MAGVDDPNVEPSDLAIMMVALMRLDAKVDYVIELLEGEDDEED